MVCQGYCPLHGRFNGYHCPMCGAWGQKEDLNFDVSFQCYTAELHFDIDDKPKIEEQHEEKEIHNHYQQRFVVFNGNEKDLIQKLKTCCTVFEKYIVWIKTMEENNEVKTEDFKVKHDAMEDYLVSRLINIHNICIPFFINMKIPIDKYNEYITNNDKLGENLELDINFNEKIGPNALNTRLCLIMMYIDSVNDIYNYLYKMYFEE